MKSFHSWIVLARNRVFYPTQPFQHSVDYQQGLVLQQAKYPCPQEYLSGLLVWLVLLAEQLLLLQVQLPAPGMLLSKRPL